MQRGRADNHPARAGQVVRPPGHAQLLCAADTRGCARLQYTPGFIHSKTFVCDDDYGICGTINLDYRSLFLHHECAVWMYKSSAVAGMKASTSRPCPNHGDNPRYAQPPPLVRAPGTEHTARPGSAHVGRLL